MVNKGLNYSPVIMMPDYRVKMHSAVKFCLQHWLAALYYGQVVFQLLFVRKE